MANINKIEQSSSLISKHFDISLNELLPEKTNTADYDFLLKQLTKVVKHLLDKDFQRLLNGLYRIDVDEKKVAQVISSTSPELVSEKIAALIIERELQKVETRQKYSSE